MWFIARTIYGKRTSVRQTQRHVFLCAESHELISWKTVGEKTPTSASVIFMFFIHKTFCASIERLIFNIKTNTIQKWQINEPTKKEIPIYYKYRRVCKNRSSFFACAYFYSWKNFRQKEVVAVTAAQNLALEQKLPVNLQQTFCWLCHNNNCVCPYDIGGEINWACRFEQTNVQIFTQITLCILDLNKDRFT